MDEYETREKLELPPAPRTLWDFVNLLAPVLKYYVALLVLFLCARWFNRQLDNEAEAQERETQRPTLSKELIRDTSSEEEEEEEEMEELVTDGDRLVPIGSKKLKHKKSNNPTKELFDGLQKVEQELRDKKDKEAQDDNVSWNELHASMLRRYKDKYPNHGPRVADPETDKYDEEFNELLRKNNINPDDFKSQGGKKTD